MAEKKKTLNIKPSGTLNVKSPGTLNIKSPASGKKKASEKAPARKKPRVNMTTNERTQKPPARKKTRVNMDKEVSGRGDKGSARPKTRVNMDKEVSGRGDKGSARPKTRVNMDKEVNGRGDKGRGKRPPANNDKTKYMIIAGIGGFMFFILIMIVALSGDDKPKTNANGNKSSNSGKRNSKSVRRIPTETQKAAFREFDSGEDRITAEVEAEFNNPPSDMNEMRTYLKKKDSAMIKRKALLSEKVRRKYKITYNELNDIKDRGYAKNW